MEGMTQEVVTSEEVPGWKAGRPLLPVISVNRLGRGIESEYKGWGKVRAGSRPDRRERWKG